jgi:hypothetical protein
MLDHAFRKNMVAAFLVAGDADFVPVVEAVTKLGTWVEVCYHPSGASKELHSTADQAIRIGFDELWGWSTDAFQRNHPIPKCDPPIHYVVSSLKPMNMKTGQDKHGHHVTFAERGDKRGEFFIYIDQGGHAGAVLYTYNSADILEKYYFEKFGVLTWS